MTNLPALPSDLSLTGPDQLKTSLPAFQGHYPKSKAEVERTVEAIKALTVPADETWIAGRIYNLLTDYFVVDVPQQVFVDKGRVWITELQPYPRWAIEKAATWWGSRHNKHRGRKPVHGDITARAEIEMGSIGAAKLMVQAFQRYGDNPPPFLRESND